MEKAFSITVTKEDLDKAIEAVKGYSGTDTIPSSLNISYSQSCVIAQAVKRSLGKECRVEDQGEVYIVGPGEDAVFVDGEEAATIVDMFDHDNRDALRDMLPITLQYTLQDYEEDEEDVD